MAAHYEDEYEDFIQNGGEGESVASAPTKAELSKGLTYFGNRICPYAHRAWWALEEKGIKPRRYIHIELGEKKPPWYKAEVNAFGTVPCVYDDGQGIFESSVVVEWLEDRFPSPPLLPKSPAARAAVRLLVSQISVGALYSVLTEQDRARDSERFAAADAALDSLEARYAAQSAGPFFLGEQLSLADISLLPFIYRFSAVLPQLRGYDVLGKRPRLAAALAAAARRPAWQATTPPEAFVVAAYGSYAAGKPGVPLRVRKSA